MIAEPTQTGAVVGSNAPWYTLYFEINKVQYVIVPQLRS